MNGTENAYGLHKELGDIMTANMTVVRYNKKLEETIAKIKELKQRYKNINVNDTSRWNNPGASFTRQLWNMLELAEAMTLGALLRNESRGLTTSRNSRTATTRSSSRRPKRRGHRMARKFLMKQWMYR